MALLKNESLQVKKSKWTWRLQVKIAPSLISTMMDSLNEAIQGVEEQVPENFPEGVAKRPLDGMLKQRECYFSKS